MTKERNQKNPPLIFRGERIFPSLNELPFCFSRPRELRAISGEMRGGNLQGQGGKSKSLRGQRFSRFILLALPCPLQNSPLVRIQREQAIFDKGRKPRRPPLLIMKSNTPEQPKSIAGATIGHLMAKVQGLRLMALLRYVSSGILSTVLPLPSRNDLIQLKHHQIFKLA